MAAEGIPANRIIYPHHHQGTMPVTTFRDFERRFRRPYAYRLDRTDAFPDKITMRECLDTSVRDTIADIDVVTPAAEFVVDDVLHDVR